MNTDDDNVTTLTKNLPANSITGAKWTVFGRSGHLRIQTSGKDAELRFDGFPKNDFDKLRQALSETHQIEVGKHALSSAGASFGLTGLQKRHLVFKECILDDADEEGEEFEPRDGDEMLRMNLADVSQCVVQGNTQNEVELQFHELDTVEAGTDQLGEWEYILRLGQYVMSDYKVFTDHFFYYFSPFPLIVGIRFYIPPDPDADPTDKDAQTPAEQLQQTITKVARIKNTAGNAIVEFDENKGTFLTPRGRYNLTLYDTYLRMHGTRYDYQIKYDDISRLFLLPKPDDVHMAFVIALDKPIRQGQQLYQMLVLQTSKEMDEITINLDEETLKKEYDGQLDPVMQGSLCNLIAKTFKIISKKKVFVPGKFQNAYGKPCVKCALRTSEGHLYPLEKSFVFIHKPPVLIRFDEVGSVEFQRYAGGQGSTRNFDLSVKLKQISGESSAKEYVFSGVDRSDFDSLYNFLSGKKISIINTQDALNENPTAAYTLAAGGDLGDDSSEDEDFGSGDGASSSDEDMSDAGESDVEMVAASDDSDLEEARNRGRREESSGQPPKKKKKKATVEVPKKKKKETVLAKSPKKSKKKKKDPNAPKRPKTAYTYFMIDVRAKLAADNPKLGFGEIGKLVGQKYKELTAEEKEVYDKQSSEDKERYEKEMKDYTPPDENSDDDDDDDDEDTSSKASSKKPTKKKVKKDPNAPKKGLSTYMLFCKEMRSKFNEENPGISFGDLGKLLGQKYQELTAEDKKKYAELAAQDKDRYEVENKAYEAKKTADANNGDDSD
jgi:structure-specific recognition protein 1